MQHFQNKHLQDHIKSHQQVANQDKQKLQEHQELYELRKQLLQAEIEKLRSDYQVDYLKAEIRFREDPLAQTEIEEELRTKFINLKAEVEDRHCRLSLLEIKDFGLSLIDTLQSLTTKLLDKGLEQSKAEAKAEQQAREQSIQEECNRRQRMRLTENASRDWHLSKVKSKTLEEYIEWYVEHYWDNPHA